MNGLESVTQEAFGQNHMCVAFPHLVCDSLFLRAVLPPPLSAPSSPLCSREKKRKRKREKESPREKKARKTSLSLFFWSVLLPLSCLLSFSVWLFNIFLSVKGRKGEGRRERDCSDFCCPSPPPLPPSKLPQSPTSSQGRKAGYFTRKGEELRKGKEWEREREKLKRENEKVFVKDERLKESAWVFDFHSLFGRKKGKRKERREEQQ